MAAHRELLQAGEAERDLAEFKDVGAPSGTVSFLFTDIEGSTRLWEESAERMRVDLVRHDEIVRGCVSRHDGFVFATGGDGFAIAFGRVSDAVECAVEVQRALKEARVPAVRMAIHTGEADERGGDYFGPNVNRAARLMAIGHGGQVLLSGATQVLAAPGVALLDLGSHRLRDLAEPERVFQLLDPALEADFPPLRSLDMFPTNLPAQSTGFVGRHDQTVETRKALEGSRLVTLTGVGGVGKTRLALQVAADVLPRFSDGVWLVELGGVADGAAIEVAAATSLGVAQQPGQAVRDAVLSFLHNKRLLVVLDNCEHLLDDAARLVSDALRAANDVSVLATSREALRVAGERVVAVPSLDTPPESAGLGVVATGDAVQLFVERARAARPSFELTGENASAVAQLCRRLDGIPLAIELAAARTRSMTPAEIAARLDQRFRLLTGGSRTAANRHQTLRGAIDWSYKLLSADEATLLRRLSVFAGGFDLAAAEQVGSTGATLDALGVDDLLGRLVEKSLVGVADAGAATRYRMLETVREYALERLGESGDTQAVRDVHAAHYAAFAEAAGVGLKGPDEAAWLLRVENNLDNLEAAVTWSLEGDDAGPALAAITALSLQGIRLEPSVCSWAIAALSSPPARSHPDFAVALAVAGWYRLHQGQAEEAARLLGDARSALHQVSARPALVCRVLSPIAGSRAVLGEDIAADTQEWVEAARAADDPYETGLASVMVAIAMASSGNPEVAPALAEEGLAMSRRSGSPTAIAYGCMTVANQLAKTDPDRAAALLDEALHAAEAAQNSYATSVASGIRGSVASIQGDYPAAARMCLRAARLAYRNGSLDHTATQLGAMAAHLARIDDVEPAAVIRAWAQKFVTVNEKMMDYNSGQGAYDALAGLDTRMGPTRSAELAALGAAMTEEEILEYAAAHLPAAAQESAVIDSSAY